MKLAKIDRDLFNSALILCVFICIATFRGATGDTPQYYYNFLKVKNFPLDPIKYYSEHGVEWTYGLLSWFSKTIGIKTPLLNFLFYSFFTCFFLAKTSKIVVGRYTAFLPYYLPTFYLSQQLIQIRQGLATAMAFYIIVVMIRKSITIRHKALSILSIFVHFSSFVPIFSAYVFLKIFNRSDTVKKFQFRLIIVSVAGIVAIRLISASEILFLIERLASYKEQTAYGSARDFWSPANIRSVALVIFFTFMLRKIIITNKYVKIIYVLYVAHVLIRFGFYDFVIISGRLATTISLGEVFLLAYINKYQIKNQLLKISFVTFYLLFQGALTFQYQTPTLLQDYFTPLQEVLIRGQH